MPQVLLKGIRILHCNFTNLCPRVIHRDCWRNFLGFRNDCPVPNEHFINFPVEIRAKLQSYDTFFCLQWWLQFGRNSRSYWNVRNHKTTDFVVASDWLWRWENFMKIRIQHNDDIIRKNLHLLINRAQTWCGVHSWCKQLKAKRHKNEENNENNSLRKWSSIVMCLVHVSSSPRSNYLFVS